MTIKERLKEIRKVDCGKVNKLTEPNLSKEAINDVTVEADEKYHYLDKYGNVLPQYKSEEVVSDEPKINYHETFEERYNRLDKLMRTKYKK
tara:strand:- start:68 stop:340 length:273 start_codon:yes stop_codon:yes gene_type:complete